MHRASVCGSAGGEVERKAEWSAQRSEVEAQRRRRAEDGSRRSCVYLNEAARDERAVLPSGTGVVVGEQGRPAARGA